MQRSSIIATVVAAGSILVAGSVASVAVINAASSTQPEPHSMALAQPLPDPAVEEVAVVAEPPAPAQPSESVAATPLPSLSDEPLPELPEVTAQPAQPSRAAVAVQPKTITGKAPAKKPVKSTTKKPAKKPASKASASPSASPSSVAVVAQAQISLEEAVQVVLNATDGGVVKSGEKTQYGGYDAWAIRVLRHDGSIITGYVDRESGVAFDWVVNQEAPAPVATSNSGSGNSGSGSSGSSHDDDHESEHESEHDDD